MVPIIIRVAGAGSWGTTHLNNRFPAAIFCVAAHDTPMGIISSHLFEICATSSAMIFRSFWVAHRRSPPCCFLSASLRSVSRVMREKWRVQLGVMPSLRTPGKVPLITQPVFLTGSPDGPLLETISIYRNIFSGQGPSEETLPTDTGCHT